MQKVTAPIVDHRILPGDYLRIRLRAREIARSARPGQFVNVLAGEGVTPYLRRPIGIEDADEASGEFSMLVRVIGPGTKLLREKKIGDTLDLLGPLGNGFALNDLGDDVIIAAGGTGIATFVHLARYIKRFAPEIRVRLFYGGKTKNDLVSLPEFEGAVSEVIATTEDGSYGEKGLVTQPLEKALAGADAHSTCLLACGPTGMMKAAADLAARFGLKCFLSLETVMGCGVGSCLGCVVKVKDDGAEPFKYLRVCTEGPVFDAAALDWEGLV